MVLVPRRWHQVVRSDPRGDGGKKARFPGESTKETVKTIAQGMPDDPADPVVTAASFFICRRAMGAACTRPSLRPLSSCEGGSPKRNSGAVVPRERKAMACFLTS